MILVSLLLGLSLGSTIAIQDEEDIRWTGHPDCRHPDSYVPEGPLRVDYWAEAAVMVCRLSPNPTLAEAEALLESQRFAFEVDLEREEIIIAARPRSGDTARAYGALNPDLEPLGQGIFASRFRLANADEAMLTFYLTPALQTDEDGGSFQSDYWRGPDAPPLRILTQEVDGEILETELYSEALGETRRLVIYTPPGHDPDAGHYPAIFMADGSVVHYYARMLEPLIQQGRIAPTVLVGTISGRRGIVEELDLDANLDIRGVDYLRDMFEPHERFYQHMDFVADELVAHAQQTYGVSQDRGDLAVNGRSNGGVFAYHAGLMRPDVFAYALPHSPGASVPGEPPEPGPQAARFFIAAGLYETGFLGPSRMARDRLSELGYEVELTELATGHTQEVTDVTLPLVLEQIFPGSNARPN